MSLSNFYTDMLNWSPGSTPLTREMQDRIYQHCVAKKDGSLLVSLARYPGLDPAIDDRIKGHDDLDVLVAWAKRPGRTPAQLSERLLSDKRVAVLKPLAALEGLPTEVYETIAKVNSAHLAEALAGNPSVPVDIRIKKIREYVQRAPRGAHHRHDERLHKMCANPKGPNGEILGVDDSKRLYETIAETTLVAPYVLACLSKPYVRETDLDRWIENFDRIAGDGYDWQSNVASIVTMIAGQNSDPARHDRLVTKVREHIARHGQSSYRTAQIQAALNKLVSFDEELEQMFRDLVASKDPVVADELVGAIRTRSKSDEDLQRLAGIVARHPHVAWRFGVELLGHMRGRDETSTFVKRLEAAGEYDLLIHMVANERFYGSLPATVRMIDDETAFMTKMVERHRSENRLLPSWVIHTELIQQSPALAAEMLPWKGLGTAFTVVKGLVNLVEERILEAIGDDPVVWEAFNGLADGFDGNLDDLVGAAKTLSA